MTQPPPAPTVDPDGELRAAPMLLVADPDTAMVHDLAVALKREGIEVTGLPDGAQGLIQTGALVPDVVPVSATSPVIGPVEFIKAVRVARAVPVPLGVGKGHAERAVQALAAGATARVARPYRVPELLPMVQAAHTGGVGRAAGRRGGSCGVGHARLPGARTGAHEPPAVAGVRAVALPDAQRRPDGDPRADHAARVELHGHDLHQHDRRPRKNACEPDWGTMTTNSSRPSAASATAW